MPGPVSWMPAVFPGPPRTVTAQEKDCAATGAAMDWEMGVLVWRNRQLVALWSALSKGWHWGCLRGLREIEIFNPEPIFNGLEHIGPHSLLLWHF